LPHPRRCYHTVSMPNVLVRDLPEDVHAELQRRAEQRGQSLQQYLAAELKRLAEKPTLQDVLARIEQRRGGEVGLQQAVDDIAEERSRR
jgi:antitoxin FitA